MKIELTAIKLPFLGWYDSPFAQELDRSIERELEWVQDDDNTEKLEGEKLTAYVKDRESSRIINAVKKNTAEAYCDYLEEAFKEYFNADISFNNVSWHGDNFTVDMTSKSFPNADALEAVTQDLSGVSFKDLLKREAYCAANKDGSLETPTFKEGSALPSEWTEKQNFELVIYCMLIVVANQRLYAYAHLKPNITIDVTIDTSGKSEENSYLIGDLEHYSILDSLMDSNILEVATIL